MKFIQAQFQRDPFWTIVILGGLLLGVLYLVGPGGQTTILATLQNVGRDPVATLQAVGAAASLVFLGLAGLLHLTPWWKQHGGEMLKGVFAGLVILFLVLPATRWGIQHHDELGQLLASFPPPRGR